MVVVLVQRSGGGVGDVKTCLYNVYTIFQFFFFFCQGTNKIPETSLSLFLSLSLTVSVCVCLSLTVSVSHYLSLSVSPFLSLCLPDVDSF